ncbi:MAG: hypothetical protein KDC73_14025 [Ignavibacteriae bacterium]|nr:hypothetical protein [Ignavibacteriota bacterium]MCB9244773.1 hypothetical protein [Ignavibacteriales bacterium]
MRSLLPLFIFLSILFSSCGEKESEDIRIKHTSPQIEKTTPPETKTETQTKEPKNTSSETNEKPSGILKPSSAGDHVGESATVKGYVADVHITKKVAFLNFDKKYPKNTFTGVIFARSFSVFDNIEQYEGKTISITGEISTYKGKPQIILENEDQIKVSE